MNPFSFAANALKGAIKVADGLGMCKGCHIRPQGGPLACQNCGAELCPNCMSRMVEHTRDHNARVRAIPGTPVAETNRLICEACSGVFGEF
jgi:hypothetical protein